MESGIQADTVTATLLCRFAKGRRIREHYTVNGQGVSITAEGDGEIAFSLPAFCFDGERSPEIVVANHSLTVSYEGWICRYRTDGRISDLDRIAANRNGHYRVFVAPAQNFLNVKIEIIKL